jgi:hypothetical protein
MTHFAGTPFGLGNPTNYSTPAVPWGVSPYTSPFSSQPIAGYGINPGQPSQQVLQLLLGLVCGRTFPSPRASSFSARGALGLRATNSCALWRDLAVAGRLQPM